MDEQQQRVKDLMARYGLGTDPQVRMLDLSSEVGELAKEVLKSTAYGTRAFYPDGLPGGGAGGLPVFFALPQRVFGFGGPARPGESAAEISAALCRKRGDRPPDVKRGRKWRTFFAPPS